MEIPLKAWNKTYRLLIFKTSGSHYSSAFAKLLWDVVFITLVRETLVLKINNL